jgi:hypothetical protein
MSEITDGIEVLAIDEAPSETSVLVGDGRVEAEDVDDEDSVFRFRAIEVPAKFGPHQHDCTICASVFRSIE